jgi:hypothetical protein
VNVAEKVFEFKVALTGCPKKLKEIAVELAMGDTALWGSLHEHVAL